MKNSVIRFIKHQTQHQKGKYSDGGKLEKYKRHRVKLQRGHKQDAKEKQKIKILSKN